MASNRPSWLLLLLGAAACAGVEHSSVRPPTESPPVSAASPPSTPAPAAPILLEAAYVDGALSLDPGDAAWTRATEQVVPFVQFLDSAGTETGPSSESVRVKAVQNGQEVFFLLTWQDATKDDDAAETHRFADAAAIQVPGSGRVLCMGSPKSPANVLFWRANLPRPQNLTAAGTGTPQVTAGAGSQNLAAAQRWRDGQWTLVLGRAMTAADGQVAFERGKQYPISFAKWDGSHAERDGRKSYTDWHTLVIR